MRSAVPPCPCRDPPSTGGCAAPTAMESPGRSWPPVAGTAPPADHVDHSRASAILSPVNSSAITKMLRNVLSCMSSLTHGVKLGQTYSNWILCRFQSVLHVSRFDRPSGHYNLTDTFLEIPVRKTSSQHITLDVSQSH